MFEDAFTSIAGSLSSPQPYTHASAAAALLVIWSWSWKRYGRSKHCWRFDWSGMTRDRETLVDPGC